MGSRGLPKTKFVCSKRSISSLPMGGRGSWQQGYNRNSTTKLLVSLFVCGVYYYVMPHSLRQLAECDSNEDTSSSASAPTKQEVSSNDEPSVIGLDELFSGPEEEEQWEKSKQECSFCSMFLSSPCKEVFKTWSKCVDTARARGVDFTVVCQPYSKALINCTISHPEHFPASPEAKDVVAEVEDDGDDSDEEEEGQGNEENSNDTSKPEIASPDDNSETV